MEENKIRQIEEIEALSSIYEDSFELENDDSYTVKIEEEGNEVRLSIKLNPGYPADSPPTYTLSAPFFTTDQRREVYNLLDRVYLDNLGECLVFLWCEEIRTFLQNLDSSVEHDNDNSVELEDDQLERICDQFSSLNDVKVVECPNIFTGESFEDRKSVFQGHVAVVSSLEEVKAVLNKLYENKKIAHATHNMYAYRIYAEERKSWLQDCEDDGESAAGGRMLHLLEIVDAKNILVVVSRWYGGILLGPDRFKHINNAARQALEQSGLLSQEKSRKKKK